MKKIHFILLGMIFVFASLTYGQDKLADAQKAIDKKDYATGLNVAKEFIDNGTPANALKLLIKLREAGYNDKKLFEYLGDAYEKMNVLELAIENYELAEKIDSLDIQTKFKTAELLYKQKRYTDAVNKYLKIISIDQNSSKAYLNAAQILYLAKLYSDASVMYEKYLSLEPSSEAYENITKAFLETKNYEKALQYASEGVVKFPNDFSIAKNGAIAAYNLKKFDEAAKYYSSVPDSMLSTSEIVSAARSFQQIKSDSVALSYFEKAVKQDSSLSSIYMDLANYNYLNKNYETAVKYYKARIKSDSTYEPAYRFMAFALMQQQKYDETRQALLKSTSLNDTLVTTRYWLAQTYRQLDSLNAAADEYQKMLQIIGNRESQYKNECADAFGFLGQRAFERKNYSGAVGYLRKAVALKNDVLAYKVMLASSLHQSGNTDEAITWYKRILTIDPKNEVAKKGLRMLSAD